MDQKYRTPVLPLGCRREQIQKENRDTAVENSWFLKPTSVKKQSTCDVLRSRSRSIAARTASPFSVVNNNNSSRTCCAPAAASCVPTFFFFFFFFFWEELTTEWKEKRNEGSSRKEQVCSFYIRREAMVRQTRLNLVPTADGARFRRKGVNAAVIFCACLFLWKKIFCSSRTDKDSKSVADRNTKFDSYLQLPSVENPNRKSWRTWFPWGLVTESATDWRLLEVRWGWIFARKNQRAENKKKEKTLGQFNVKCLASVRLATEPWCTHTVPDTWHESPRKTFLRSCTSEK